VPDFPKEGILFNDVTTLFMNPEAYNACLEELYNKVKDLNIDVVAGIESRGFILGFALA
jgi:adenine phosphoribosyltransferase